jgi:DNA-directed RNA polymerase specialized sigma24 family protein
MPVSSRSRADRHPGPTGIASARPVSSPQGSTRWSPGAAVDIPEECDAVIKRCFRRISSWRVPLNWGTSDWFAEMRATIQGAAWQALWNYDSARGVPISAFVYQRVMARALTRYRQEWAYALRCICQPAPERGALEPSKDGANGVFGVSVTPLDGAWNDKETCEAVLRALERLSTLDQWVIEQLFWRERTESQLGLDLGVSHQAVSKRKLAILRRLRLSLEDSRDRPADSRAV